MMTTEWIWQDPPMYDFRTPLEGVGVDDVRERIIAQLMAFPAITKEPDELTDAERIALCIVAGCKMNYRTEATPEGGYRFVASTVNPVGIVKINGKFSVCERV
jgi:hypothetical protein